MLSMIKRGVPMKYKSWVLDILSIVRNAANNPNKNGIVIIVFMIIIIFLVLYIINKNDGSK